MKITDDSIMPWGAHKGKQMSEVPDSYLLWLYENNKVSGVIREYIKDNLDAIKSNCKI